MIKKIAILTSGGDAPGMNPAIRAIIKESLVHGIEPYIVYNGYKGLTNGEIHHHSKINVDAIMNEGGTIIGSARFPEFKNEETRIKAKNNLDKHGVDALVVIGGDGSYQGAQLLHELGVKTMALPGTIDNDITSSDFTIGYDTALNTIVENVERVKDTMRSHDRCGIVEVMGHGNGDLALFSAIATGANLVVTNENKMSAEDIGAVVKSQHEKGKRGILVIVSEYVFDDLPKLSKVVQEYSGVVTRAMSLKHVQRGGRPTSQERINATRMGRKAVKLLINGDSGLAIGILSGHTASTPILEALEIPRTNRKKYAENINKLNQM